jgi:hypothetical protein
MSATDKKRRPLVVRAATIAAAVVAGIAAFLGNVAGIRDFLAKEVAPSFRKTATLHVRFDGAPQREVQIFLTQGASEERVGDQALQSGQTATFDKVDVDGIYTLTWYGYTIVPGSAPNFFLAKGDNPWRLGVSGQGPSGTLLSFQSELGKPGPAVQPANAATIARADPTPERPPGNSAPGPEGGPSRAAASSGQLSPERLNRLFETGSPDPAPGETSDRSDLAESAYVSLERTLGLPDSPRVRLFVERAWTLTGPGPTIVDSTACSQKLKANIDLGMACWRDRILIRTPPAMRPPVQRQFDMIIAGRGTINNVSFDLY